MYRRAARPLLAALLLALVAPALRAADEIGPLAWSLPRERMLRFRVAPLKGGKPQASERVLTVFGSELLPAKDRKEHTFRVRNHRDLPYHFLFVLPDQPVKPGQRWNYEKVFFEGGVNSFPTGLSLLWGDRLDPVIVKGQYRFKGMEKIDGREVATLEGAFTISAVKRGEAGKPLGTVRTLQHLALDGPTLVRARWELQVKGEEIQDIRHGFMRTTVKLDTGEQLDLESADRELTHEALSQGINQAIERGLAWLLTQARPNGSYKEDQAYSEEFPVGSTALVLMALLHSGVKPDHPAVEAGFAFIRKASYKQHTYDAALLLQAIEAKYLPFEKLEDVKNFNEAEARKALQERISPDDRKLLEEATEWLLAKMGRTGTWGYPECNDTGFDNSNTQYALLGLKSAARCGVPVEADVWKKTVKHFLENQIILGDPQVDLDVEFEGEEEAAAAGEIVAKAGAVSPKPWGYAVTSLRPMEKGYASMTCAGLTSLIIAESELFAQDRLDAGLRDDIARSKREGLAYLQLQVSPRCSGPASGYWTTFFHYYLYSLERVGVLYGIKRIGGHDWYLEGAQGLLETQEKDGHWVGDDRHPVTDTAFALLFLKKATRRVLTR